RRRLRRRSALGWRWSGDSFRTHFGNGSLRGGLLGTRAGLEQNAAHQIGDLIGNDAKLVLRFEDPAETLIEELDELF
ncbi:MAG TPA: hypothetical protein VKB39_06785, partial [Candidatus Baltobacteraceae bacterium]|nr:hypothetical protein [Candidatus Baltobacteraceae bacterium]